MNAIWITSMVLQWAMIAVLTVLVLSLMRQLGERTKPPANTDMNPDEIFHPFSDLPEHRVALIGGKEFAFGGPRGEPALIVFFSPTCGACEQLPEAIRAFTGNRPASPVRLLAVLKRVDFKTAMEFIEEQELTSASFALEEDFPPSLNPGAAPFAAAVTEGGVVAARGKPKILKHLVEMAYAAQHMAHGVPDHSRQPHDWGESAPYWSPEQLAGAPRPLPSEASETVG